MGDVGHERAHEDSVRGGDRDGNGHERLAELVVLVRVRNHHFVRRYTLEPIG